jgi:hypothetical protein
LVPRAVQPRRRIHLQALEHLAAILHRDVDLVLHHLEVGRRRRLVLAVDRRRARPLEPLVGDLGDHDVVRVLAVVDPDQRADLEPAGLADVRLAGADLEVTGQQRARARGVDALEPDVVSPLALVERADLERRLVPVVDLDVIGARRVVDRRQRSRRRGVRDAHDPHRVAAVLEEAVDRVGQVVPIGVAEDLDELVPARDPGRLVHRPLEREAEEAGDPGVGDLERRDDHRIDGLVDAGGTDICGRSHSHGR